MASKDRHDFLYTAGGVDKRTLIPTASKLLVDISAVGDKKNQDSVFRPGVDDTIITDTEPQEARELAFQRLTSIWILLQFPLNLVKDTLGIGFAEAL